MNSIPAGIRVDRMAASCPAALGRRMCSARRQPLGGRLDPRLKPRIHRPRRDADDRFDRDPAGSGPVGLADELMESLFAAAQARRVGVAELDLHLRPAGDHRGRVRLDR